MEQQHRPRGKQGKGLCGTSAKAQQLHSSGGPLCWASTICCWTCKGLAFPLSLVDTLQVVLQGGLGGVL